MIRTISQYHLAIGVGVEHCLDFIDLVSKKGVHDGIGDGTYFLGQPGPLFSGYEFPSAKIFVDRRFLFDLFSHARSCFGG